VYQMGEYYIVRRTPGRETRIGSASCGNLICNPEPPRRSCRVSRYLSSRRRRTVARSFSRFWAVIATKGAFGQRLDRSSSPRVLQTNADDPRFVSGHIYMSSTALSSGYVHRIRPDASGDEQIWNEKFWDRRARSLNARARHSRNFRRAWKNL
jgi:hypothetical protein